jgi:hypothetical protein
VLYLAGRGVVLIVAPWAGRGDPALDDGAGEGLAVVRRVVRVITRVAGMVALTTAALRNWELLDSCDAGAPPRAPSLESVGQGDGLLSKSAMAASCEYILGPARLLVADGDESRCNEK